MRHDGEGFAWEGPDQVLKIREGPPLYLRKGFAPRYVKTVGVLQPETPLFGEFLFDFFFGAPLPLSQGDIRKAFANYDTINDFPSVDAKDLEITKSSGELVVSFSYEKRIPLVANVSLVIDFSGSSN